MASFVYVLGSFHKGRYATYVGWTNDVARRLAQHNAGTGARTTGGACGCCCTPKSLPRATRQ